MNRKNVKLVRDHIAKLSPARFDMRSLHIVNGYKANFGIPNDRILIDCGTAACIAGWTNAILGNPDSEYDDATDAAARLGLDEREADDLFTPRGFDVKGRFTRAQAVAVLDHLLETGKVDWSVAEKVAA